MNAASKPAVSPLALEAPASSKKAAQSHPVSPTEQLVKPVGKEMADENPGLLAAMESPKDAVGKESPFGQARESVIEQGVDQAAVDQPPAKAPRKIPQFRMK